MSICVLNDIREESNTFYFQNTFIVSVTLPFESTELLIKIRILDNLHTMASLEARINRCAWPNKRLSLVGISRGLEIGTREKWMEKHLHKNGSGKMEKCSENKRGTGKIDCGGHESRKDLRGEQSAKHTRQSLRTTNKQ